MKKINIVLENILIFHNSILIKLQFIPSYSFEMQSFALLTFYSLDQIQSLQLACCENIQSNIIKFL